MSDGWRSVGKAPIIPLNLRIGWRIIPAADLCGASRRAASAGTDPASRLPFHRKLQTIRDYLYGPSLSRDHWLDLLISASPDLTSAQLEEVLAEIQNPSLRDRIAIKTLEKKRLEQPGEFRTLEGELQWIRHYFPDFSPIRDDLLLQVIDEQARTLPKKNAFVLTFCRRLKMPARRSHPA